jgi:hypothetical protein
MEFSFLYLVASFGGGLLGAALGGLPVFVLCGVAAVVGAGITAATGDATFMNLVAFGPLLGPQVSFAGGAAAAAYAAKKGKLSSGRDIVTAMMGIKSMDTLIVGGLFGVLGYILWWALANLPMIGGTGATNPIAFSIVINAIIARLLFGKTGVFGKVRSGDNRWRASDVAVWLPWQTQPVELLVVGVSFGLVVAFSTVQMPALAGVWFGISVASLVFLQYGTTVPVWHHIALSTEFVIAIGGADLWWGVTFAVLAAFLGDFFGMLFTAHGDNHIDPPSATLATTFTLMAILKATGLLAVHGTASLVILVVVSALCFGVFTALKSRPHAAVEGAPSAAD